MNLAKTHSSFMVTKFLAYRLWTVAIGITATKHTQQITITAVLHQPFNQLFDVWMNWQTAGASLCLPRLNLEIIWSNILYLQTTQFIDAATGIHAQQDQFPKHIVTIPFRSIDDRPTFSSAKGKIGFCLDLNSFLPGVGLILHKPSRINQKKGILVWSLSNIQFQNCFTQFECISQLESDHAFAPSVPFCRPLMYAFSSSAPIASHI